MAATSELDVANLALQRIGVAPSSNLSGTDKASVAANRILADTRDEVQAMFPWNCIITREALASTTIGSTFSAFSYVHTLGLSCLRVLDVIDVTDSGAENVPYRREYRNLYTDLSAGYVRYLKQTTNITPWDPLMLTAIETRMASKLAVWLTGKTQLAQMMYQEFLLTISTAVRMEAIEKKYEDTTKLLAMLNEQFIPALM
ncbi:MAG: hypothetical protein ABIJ57_01265, partial [Pseudomonadota bacterium]